MQALASALVTSAGVAVVVPPPQLCVWGSPAPVARPVAVWLPRHRSVRFNMIAAVLPELVFVNSRYAHTVVLPLARLRIAGLHLAHSQPRVAACANSQRRAAID